jgi:recombinational DNA repair ATPase RecF
VFVELFSWKRSLERLNSEYEAVVKKRHALNSLLESGRISRPTHELFESEMNEAIAEIERQRKALLDKMAVKAKELDEEIKTLEKLLANFEIQHVGGEIEEEVYQREIALLSMGLESTRQELNTIKETIEKLTNLQVAESPPATTSGGTKNR